MNKSIPTIMNNFMDFSRQFPSKTLKNIFCTPRLSKKMCTKSILIIYLAHVELNLNSNFLQKLNFHNFICKLKVPCSVDFMKSWCLQKKMNVNFKNCDIQFFSHDNWISKLSKKMSRIPAYCWPPGCSNINSILTWIFSQIILRSHCAFCAVTVHWTCVVFAFFLKSGQKWCQSCQRPTPIGHFFVFFVVFGVCLLHFCDIWICTLVHNCAAEYKFRFHNGLQVCERFQRLFLPFWPGTG